MQHYSEWEKGEGTQMSMNRWIDKQMWYSYTMEYYSAMKRMKYDTFYNGEEPPKHTLSDISQPQQQV